MAKGKGGRAGLGGAAALACLGLVTTVACQRQAQDAPALPPDQLANAVEAVRVEHKVAPKPPRRLDFLRPADLARAGGGILCTLSQQGRPLLLAVGTRAMARVDGKPVVLDLSGPMSASAAFFRGPGVTVSIGRHAVVEPKADAPGIAWPVGVTVGGLDTVQDEKIDATWTCGAPAVAPVRPAVDSAQTNRPPVPKIR